MLLTTDLHLTARTTEEYRWRIFSVLAEEASNRNTQDICILGDLTDAKDGHSAKLVNRIVDAIVDLRKKTGCHIWILKGNHDYLDPETPFFRFLDHFEGVTFITKPMQAFVNGWRVLWLPHSFTPEKEWESVDITDTDFVLCHQTFDGANAHGHTMKVTLSARYFIDRGLDGLVYSGDIHQPQKLRNIEYIGTPYPVGFGEDHAPRILHLEESDEGTIEETWIPVPSIKREIRTADDPADLFAGLTSGDHLKARLRLPREEFVDWPHWRDAIVEMAATAGVELHSVELAKEAPNGSHKPGTASEGRRHHLTPQEAVERFSRSRGLTLGHRMIADTLLDGLE